MVGVPGTGEAFVVGSDQGGRQPSKRVVIGVTLGVFAFAVICRDLVLSIGWYRAAYDALPTVMRWLEDLVRTAVIVFAALWLVYRLSLRGLLHEVGLARAPWRAWLFGFLASAPMLVGFAAVGNVASDFDFTGALLFGAIIWPMTEELLFRGYAFGQLHRRGKVNLWVAAILTGAVFGLLHLGNASVKGLPWSGELGVVAITSIGGILFCWLFARWEFDLWAPFALHGFMNLWWSVFDLADSPLGGWFTNGLRLVTVVLAIVLTLYRERIPGLRSVAARGVVQEA